MNVVVYTALFGDIDKLWSPPPVSKIGVKYVVFTERHRHEAGLWTTSGRGKIAILKGSGNLSSMIPRWTQKIVDPPKDPRRSARYFKTMAHEVLPEADATIWIDANIRLLTSPLDALKWLQTYDLAAFKHPDRTCLFQEAQFCIEVNKGTSGQIQQQVFVYREKGMPSGWGLASTRCVIRRHTAAQAKLNEAWWQEIQQHSVRDQISLPYVCWKQGKYWDTIPGHALHHNQFWFIRHGKMP